MLVINDVPTTKYPFRVEDTESDLCGDEPACFKTRADAELFVKAKEQEEREKKWRAGMHVS